MGRLGAAGMKGAKQHPSRLPSPPGRISGALVFSGHLAVRCSAWAFRGPVPGLGLGRIPFRLSTLWSGVGCGIGLVFSRPRSSKSSREARVERVPVLQVLQAPTQRARDALLRCRSSRGSIFGRFHISYGTTVLGASRIFCDWRARLAVLGFPLGHGCRHLSDASAEKTCI